MPGDDWQKRANFRLLCADMCAHPGKKLFFMGSEFGQWNEWRNQEELAWRLLEEPAHRGLQDCVRALNHLYLATPEFYSSDCDPAGFKWVDMHNSNDSVWAFERSRGAGQEGAGVICLFNATPVPRPSYAIAVPAARSFQKVFDSDETRFGGSGYNQQSHLDTAAEGLHGQAHSLCVDLPPLGAIFLRGPT